MSEEPKGYERDQVKAAIEFALGKITQKQLERYHPTGQGVKWKHMKYLKKNSFIWYQLIEKLPVHFRLKALLDSEDLSIPKLKKNMQITNSDNYINKENFALKSKEIPQTLLKLAIVFDVPLGYVRGFDTNLLDLSGFEEYDYLMINEITPLKDAVTWTLNEVIYRRIQGYIIDNSKQQAISFIDDNKAYVRVDKNESIFRFEIFLTSKPYADVKQIEQLVNQFKRLVHYIYKENSLLRNTPKLTLIGTYNLKISQEFKDYISKLIRQSGVEKIYPF
jgi:hypothetical protein